MCVNCCRSTGDMYTPENGESEPDWVQTEKKHFSECRDANKVKVFDQVEVAAWMGSCPLTTILSVYDPYFDNKIL